jgi:uracil-DNA glycosylase
MKCDVCGTNCGAINPGFGPEGNGPILIVLDELTSEMDFNGRYFAGANGRVLEDMLKRAGITRTDCTFSCVESCPGVAWRLFELSRNASTIVALGESALHALCGKGGIKSKRGNSYPLRKEFESDLQVWPTYSLGLVRKVPTYRNIVVTDLQRATSTHKVAETIDWKYYVA